MEKVGNGRKVKNSACFDEKGLNSEKSEKSPRLTKIAENA